MAQTEDTELRDLVIEALEKNGSLAKIRALLRANIFLAFEDDYENIKQNITLDNILQLPEGLLSLSLVYEFLEFCNLKNTLFVYKSETRQDKEYKYEGQKVLLDKLNLKEGNNKEPVLVSILKNIFKSSQRHYLDKTNPYSHAKNENHNDINKDDQNCTYIVHEDSSSTSNSHSDNSSDEKTKLHLRLPLDNSDTDTSSDSTRDKSSSEYIPNEHLRTIDDIARNESVPQHSHDKVLAENFKNSTMHSNKELPYFFKELKISNNSSSDSTSYAELKPLNMTEGKLLTLTSIQATNINPSNENNPKNDLNKNNMNKTDSPSSTLNSVSSTSLKNNNKKESIIDKKSSEKSIKSDTDSVDYSYDFSASASKTQNVLGEKTPSSQQIEDSVSNDNVNLNSPANNSQHGNSESSRSSVSISDVADLISENSLSHADNDVEDKPKVLINTNSSQAANMNISKDDSGEFSDSPVPSLSNLSLDIHSD